MVVSLITGTGSGGDAEGDELTGIEGLDGSDHGDTLLGDDGGNTLSAGGGSDTVKGFGGDDYIWGGNDADTLYGMDGDDFIDGGAGHDDISGGTGRDMLEGEGGADTFVWGSTSETYFLKDRDGVVYDGCNMDVIEDFNSAEGDLIDLSGIDADLYVSGNQAFTFIGNAAFSGTPGELNYYQSGGDTYIQMQTGTSTDIEGVILLPGIHRHRQTGLCCEALLLRMPAGRSLAVLKVDALTFSSSGSSLAWRNRARRSCSCANIRSDFAALSPSPVPP